MYCLFGQGAIEGCNMGLVRYCSQLLLSSDPLLHALPGLLLDKVLLAYELQ